MQQYTEEQQQTADWIRSISEDSGHGIKQFYRTYIWVKKRQQILERDHYMCQLCKKKGRYTRASTVHHIKHLKEFPELALTDDNLISLCSECHEEVHPEKQYKPKGFRNQERW